MNDLARWPRPTGVRDHEPDARRCHLAFCEFRRRRSAEAAPSDPDGLPTVVASYKENGKDQYRVYHPDFESPIAVRLGDWTCQLSVSTGLVKDDPNYDVASAECSADGKHFAAVQALRNMGPPKSAALLLETGGNIYSVNVEW